LVDNLFSWEYLFKEMIELSKHPYYARQTWHTYWLIGVVDSGYLEAINGLLKERES